VKFALRIPGRDEIEPAPAANSANPLILARVQGDAAESAVNDDASVAAEQAPISGLAGLATLATCESEYETTGERSASIRALKPEMVALLAGAESRPPATRTTLSSVGTCTECQHLLQDGTCAEPESAGLIPAGAGFGVVWPPAEHATTCASYSSKTIKPAYQRPHKLTKAQDRPQQADAWNGAAAVRFQTRVRHFQRDGLAAQEAQGLAKRLHMRDVQADGRHLCVECRHYRPGHCGNHRAAGLHSPEVGQDLAEILQRCDGFRPIKGAPALLTTVPAV